MASVVLLLYMKTLSQPLGETNVLIKAPGANNVDVQRGTGISTDWRGYAVVPYATEYRRNNISLDPMSMNMHTELDITSTEVILGKGALVRAEFAAHIGIRVCSQFVIVINQSHSVLQPAHRLKIVVKLPGLSAIMDNFISQDCL